MRLGICTTDFATMGADALFRQIGEMGFESVQFSFASIVESGYEARGDWEIPPAIAPETVRLVRGCARRYGLEIVAVNGTYNMAHPDAEVRQEGARRFAVLAQAAAELGASMVSLCTGTRNRDSLWQVSPENDSAQAWHDMLEGVEQLLPQASALGLALGVEVEASNVVNTARRARDLLDACGSDALKIILDCANLFHAGKAHPRFVRETIGEAFALLGGDIALAHGKERFHCKIRTLLDDSPNSIFVLRRLMHGKNLGIAGERTHRKVIPKIVSLCEFMQGVYISCR